MARHVVRSSAELPAPPDCTDLEVYLHEKDEITGARAEALRRFFSARYGVPVGQTVGDPSRDREDRFDAILGSLGLGNSLQRGRYRLEYEDPQVTLVPPATTTTYGDLHFYIEEEK